MINEEIARKTLNMEVRAAKVTGKLILNLLKKLMKEAEKLGGLEKLVNSNGNEVKLKDIRTAAGTARRTAKPADRRTGPAPRAGRAAGAIPRRASGGLRSWS